MSASKALCLVVALALMTGATAEARISHGYSAIFSLDTVTAVGDDAGGPAKTATLAAIYPNPFNPRTTIEFALTQAGSVELAIYDQRGRLVRRLERGAWPIGHHRATWDGCDNTGRPVPAAAYFCRLKTPWGTQTKKLTLAR